MALRQSNPKPGPRRRKFVYIPVSPDGSYLYNLQSTTHLGAVIKLIRTAHFRTKFWPTYVKMGYRIDKLEEF